MYQGSGYDICCVSPDIGVSLYQKLDARIGYSSLGYIGLERGSGRRILILLDSEAVIGVLDSVEVNSTGVRVPPNPSNAVVSQHCIIQKRLFKSS